MSCRSTLRSMIGNIKKLFPPKTGMQKSENSKYRALINLNFHLIRRKTLPTNDFKLTMPDLYSYYKALEL